MATATTLTGAEFDEQYAHDERRLELLGGEVVEMPSATLIHARVVLNIAGSFFLYFRERPDAGEAASDVEFALDENWRVRPDVFVLLAARKGSIDPGRVPIPGAPDIAIEVISPSEHAADALDKVQAYLRAGTKEVWQAYPKTRTILVHTTAGIGRIDAGGRIATPLLPGFELELKNVF